MLKFWLRFLNPWVKRRVFNYRESKWRKAKRKVKCVCACPCTGVTVNGQRQATH